MWTNVYISLVRFHPSLLGLLTEHGWGITRSSVGNPQTAASLLSPNLLKMMTPRKLRHGVSPVSSPPLPREILQLLSRWNSRLQWNPTRRPCDFPCPPYPSTRACQLLCDIAVSKLTLYCSVYYLPWLAGRVNLYSKIASFYAKRQNVIQLCLTPETGIPILVSFFFFLLFWQKQRERGRVYCGSWSRG